MAYLSIGAVVIWQEESEYLGLTKANAIALAKQNGVRFRIISINGAGRMITGDFWRDRVNFDIVNDVVTGVSLG